MVAPHPFLSEAGQCLAPYVPRDPLMALPWFGHLRFCLGEDEILAAFRADTGYQWRPGTTPIERMVDDATGAGQAFLMQFAAWVNTHLWGPINEKE